MKISRLLCAAAICALGVSCNKIGSDDPAEDYSLLPDYTVTTDGSGNNISKIEYVYKTSGYTESETHYVWEDEDWKQAHAYQYSYEFGSYYILTRYTKSENGNPVLDYFYDYYSSGLLGLAEYNLYVDGELSESILQQYTYNIDNDTITARTIYTYDEEEEEWNETEQDEYEYNDSGALQSLVVKTSDGSKLTEYSKSVCSYTDGNLTGTSVYLKDGADWVLYQKNTCTFDAHDRKITEKVEFSGDAAQTAEHPVTVTTYHYTD